MEQEPNFQALQDIAHKMRILSIEMTTEAGSGHPTSCSSMAEIISVLFFDAAGMHYDAQKPAAITNDRFVLSKGHCAPILYAAWCEAGFLERKECMRLRKFDCDLEGHPMPRLPFVDVGTGSLGQGLGVAAGMAYTSKHWDKLDNRYWAVLGDGECTEGSVWEACHFASLYKLNNLTAIVDVNRLGQSEATSVGHAMEIYEARFKAFGWNTIVVDGQSCSEIQAAFANSRQCLDKPTMVVAKTFKGKYMEGIEDQDDQHGKPMAGKTTGIVEAIKKMIKDEKATIAPTKPTCVFDEPKEQNFTLGELPYKLGDMIATRNAYGTGIKRLGDNDKDGIICALDGDTKNSTYSITFQKAHPERFVECFIAEQNIVSVATGLSCRRKVPFCSTFAAFFSRAADQIRMGGLSGANVKYAGSHVGVSIGEDGPSQMALEDLGIFRAVPNGCVFYPSDAVSAERACELAANYKGPCYIRTSRPTAPVVYSNTEVFKVGQSKVTSSSDSDKLTIVAGGVTFDESNKAAKILKEAGINVRIVDIFCIKPFDKDTILSAAKATNNTVLCVEDHYKEGGIFEAVCSGLGEESGIKVYSSAVGGIPRSGKAAELLKHFGIDAESIVNKVKSILA